jgi:hypothetical protein
VIRRLAARLDRNEDGFAMLTVLGLIVLLTVLAFSLINVMQGEASRSRTAVKHDAAFQAAEAGVDEFISKVIDDRLYYVHTVHPGESTRRASTSGRLVTAGSTWLQTDGNSWTYTMGKNNWFGSATLGNGYEYNLEIVPPSAIQPLIRILSTARPVNDPDIRNWRELEVLMRPSSVSDYQMVAGADIGYGAGATTYGKIYAGIDAAGVRHNVRHDGIAYGDIYAEGAVTGNTSFQNGAKKYDSTNIRTVIPQSINFSSFLASLVDISKAGSAGGIVLNTPTVDAWWMSFQMNGQIWVQACMKVGGKPIGDVKPTCGSAIPYTIPANGAIYSNQPVIVSGIVNGRVTVGGASDLYIGDNLTYAQDGDDVLGLVASHSVIVAQWVPSTLNWRAATLAQSGTWRSYGFDAQASPTGEPDYVGNFQRTSMTFTGSTATYGGGSMSLFATRVYQYDQTLVYLPPPWFPIFGDPYTIVLSREVTASAS